jgi:hypothetical protein
MTKPRATKKIPIAIQVAIWGFLATILAALIPIGAGIGAYFERASTPPPSPTAACVSAAAVLVRFKILDNNMKVIARLAPNETAFLEPGSLVYIEPEFTSLSSSPVPEGLECAWTNTEIGTDGKLLHSTSCTMIDYQSGRTRMKDAVSLQLSQPGRPTCPAMESYSFFIMPKP